MSVVNDDASRGLVLGFKHSDRLHGAPAFGRWLARAGAERREPAHLALSPRTVNSMVPLLVALLLPAIQAGRVRALASVHVLLSESRWDGANLRQIAEVLHVTESRVSQIRTQALKRLRQRLAPMEERA